MHRGEAREHCPFSHRACLAVREDGPRTRKLVELEMTEGARVARVEDGQGTLLGL